MRIAFLLPLVFLSLAGCIDVHEHPAPTSTTVTPAPAPTATYVTPAPPSTTTVVRTP